RHHLEFLDVDRREYVVFHYSLGEQDGILEVVAIPWHERDQYIAAEREFAEIGRRAVGNDVALVDAIAYLHQRTLIDAGVLVRALILHQTIDIDTRLCWIGLISRADNDTSRVHLIDDAGASRCDRRARVSGDYTLHPGADKRRLGAHEWDRLTLHVGAHQRPVGVIVFQEWDYRGSNRDQLLRRHIHEVDPVARHQVHVASMAAHDQIFSEAATAIDCGIRLRDRMAAFLHRGEIDHLIGHSAVLDLAVRRLNETVFIYTRVSCERIDQANVWPFRRLDRTDPAIVRRVHVAYLEPSALAGKTARAKRRQPPLVGDLRQRIGLVHELRQLRGAEELAHRGRCWLGVDQILRHDSVDID